MDYQDDPAEHYEHMEAVVQERRTYGEMLFMLALGAGAAIFSPADSSGAPTWLKLAFGVVGVVCFFMAGLGFRRWRIAAETHASYHE